MLILGIDLDNTLADFTTNAFDRFEKQFGIRFSKEDIENIHTGVFPEYWESKTDIPRNVLDKWIREEMDKQGFFLDQKPVDDFYDFYEFYHDYVDVIDVFFVTSVSPLSTFPFSDKSKWVSKWLKIEKPQMIYTKFKWLVNVDVLIDDHVENCQNWIERGNSENWFYLYPQPYNKKYFELLSEDYSDLNVYRPNGWEDICKYLRQVVD